jgi:hypothetical protein
MFHLDSGFFLNFQVNIRERYREGGNISLKIAKRSPSMKEKLQHAFRRLVLPDDRRF